MTQVPASAEILSGDTADIRKPESNEVAEIQDRIFRSLFDSYIETADGKGSIPSVVGTDPITKNPIFHYYDRDVITEMRLTELRQYVKVSIIDNGLEVNTSLLEPGQKVGIDALVELYIEDGVFEARMRAQAREKLANHVTASQVDTDPQTTHSFMEIVKGFAKNAFRSIDPTTHYHSGEIPLQTGSIPHDEMRIIARSVK